MIFDPSACGIYNERLCTCGIKNGGIQNWQFAGRSARETRAESPGSALRAPCKGAHPAERALLARV